MKLKSGEHSVLAYFPSSTKAAEAVEDLKAAGIELTQIDRISMFGSNTNSEIDNPISGDSYTQSGLILYSGNSGDHSNPDAGVLLSATPSVSGNAGDFQREEANNILVTVVVPNQKINQAIRILEEHGAKI